MQYKLFFADMDIDDDDVFNGQPYYERDELGRKLAFAPTVMLDKFVVYESRRVVDGIEGRCFAAKDWLAEWKQLYDPTRPLNVRKT